MANWGTWYWRGFNVAVRALGLVALVYGAVFIIWGAVRMVQMEYIRLDEARSLVILPVGLLVAALGAAILKVPAYRPDLGDVPWRFDPLGTKTRQSPGSRRSWWTGDRLTES